MAGAAPILPHECDVVVFVDGRRVPKNEELAPKRVCVVIDFKPWLLVEKWMQPVILQKVTALYKKTNLLVMFLQREKVQFRPSLVGLEVRLMRLIIPNTLYHPCNLYVPPS